MAGRRGEDDPLGRRRVMLILSVSIFVGLAATVAFLSDDRPAVAAGEVAVVDGLPAGIDTVTDAELRQALTQQAAIRGLDRPPAPGGEKYEELRKAALDELVGALWLRGGGEDMGIRVSREQITAKLRREGGRRSLEEAHYTPATIRERVEADLLVILIEDELRREAVQPSARELEIYYEEEKETQFTTPEKRDLRVIAAESPAEAEAAKRALESDRSAENWKEVAFRYSYDSATRAEGGLLPGKTEASLLAPLRSPTFDAAAGDLIGPIEAGSYYFAVEVVAREPAKTKPFAEVRSAIRQTLQGQKQQEVYSAWDAAFYEKWHAVTYCTEEMAVEKCSNYIAYSEPTALPACLDAESEEPPEGCQAAVVQTRPALPGSVTELNRDGEPYVQRPIPDAVDAATSGETSAFQSLAEVPR